MIRLMYLQYEKSITDFRSQEFSSFTFIVLTQEVTKVIISLHLPKTAGTSFAATLEQHFGTRLLKDYTDLPINTPEHERNKAAIQASLCNAENDFSDIECIHGYFLPIKYLLLANKRDLRFVTWMRNPVERVLSHYFFWKRTYDPRTAPPLRRKVIEEDWSIERFCLGPEVRDLYWQFLWGFPIEYFDFIGVTEFYEDDLEFFARQYLQTPIEPIMLNVGDKGEGGYRIDVSLRKKIESFHARDMDLYQRVLEKRKHPV